MRKAEGKRILEEREGEREREGKEEKIANPLNRFSYFNGPSKLCTSLPRRVIS